MLATFGRGARRQCRFRRALRAVALPLFGGLLWLSPCLAFAEGVAGSLPGNAMPGGEATFVKWSQVPLLELISPYPECYWGWGEYSVRDGEQIVGDDWLCEDDRPVSGIRWWGTYSGWGEEGPPAESARGFHITLWTDVPAGTDEEWSDGVHVEHTFETSGIHIVRLKVVDETGLAGTAEIAIAVENTPPLASCRFSSDSPIVGEWILFDASTSFDPDGRLVDFVWDFGDGTTSRGTRVGHAYEEVGVYSVRLTVEDDAGATASLVHTFTVHLGSTGGGCGG